MQVPTDVVTPRFENTRRLHGITPPCYDVAHYYSAVSGLHGVSGGLSLWMDGQGDRNQDGCIALKHRGLCLYMSSINDVNDSRSILTAE